MNFLEFAVWGAYLTSLGTYLASHGLGNDIGSFYVIQGIVSIFMPGLMGIVADRWVPSQRRTRQTLWRAVQMLTQKLCCQTIHDCPKVVPLHYESE